MQIRKLKLSKFLRFITILYKINEFLIALRINSRVHAIDSFQFTLEALIIHFLNVFFIQPTARVDQSRGIAAASL